MSIFYEMTAEKMKEYFSNKELADVADNLDISGVDDDHHSECVHQASRIRHFIRHGKWPSKKIDVDKIAREIKQNSQQ